MFNGSICALITPFREGAVDDGEIRMTDPTVRHPHLHEARSGRLDLDVVGDDQRLPRGLQHCGSHLPPLLLRQSRPRRRRPRGDTASARKPAVCARRSFTG